VGRNLDSIPYLGYIRDTLKGRVKELELVNHVYDQVIQEHEMTWGKEYE